MYQPQLVDELLKLCTDLLDMQFRHLSGHFSVAQAVEIRQIRERATNMGVPIRVYGKGFSVLIIK